MTAAHPAVSLDVATEYAAWTEALPEAEALAERAVQAALDGAEWPVKALGATACELSVALADDATVHALNRDYRGKDKPTNVLSFALLDEPDSDFSQADEQATFQTAPGVPILLGDVILAFETVAAEAAQQGKPLADHVTHLIVHGVLHLLGYDHQNDAEAERMERLETALLRSLGVPDPYAEDRGPGLSSLPHHS